MRFRSMGVALIALGLASVPLRVSASLITLPVLGGPGLDDGQVCPTALLCPGNATLALTTDGAVSGSFVYDNVGNTVSFSLTLLSAAVFTGGGPPASVLPGTAFTAVGIPVLNIPLGGGQYELVQIGPATAVVAPVGWGAPYSQIVFTPDVSSLVCVVNTGADQCGVSLGPGGNIITDGVSPYQVLETFNVNVPEPTTMALIGFGVLGLAWAGSKRA
jgi:hypothetical protein